MPVGRINEGKEVGDIVEQTLGLEAEDPTHAAGQLRLNGRQGLGGQAIHLIPEEFARDLGHVEMPQPAQSGGAGPPGPTPLGGGMQRPPDSRQ